MKTILTIIAVCIVLTVSGEHGKIIANGTVSYWEYSFSYTTKDGCKGYNIATCTMSGPDSNIGFYDIKGAVAKWMYPHKLLRFQITGIRPIKKSQLLKKSIKFSCNNTNSTVSQSKLYGKLFDRRLGTKACLPVDSEKTTKFQYYISPIGPSSPTWSTGLWVEGKPGFGGRIIGNTKSELTAADPGFIPFTIISTSIKDTTEQHRIIHAIPEFETGLDTSFWNHTGSYDWYISIGNNKNALRPASWLKQNNGKWYSNWPYVFELICGDKRHIKVYKLEEVYNWETK